MIDLIHNWEITDLIDLFICTEALNKHVLKAKI